MIEKMEMMNLVGHMNDIDQIMRDIVFLNGIHPVDAMKEISGSHFTLSMLEENADEIVNMCEIDHYKPSSDYKLIDKKLEYLMKQLGISSNVTKLDENDNYDFDDVICNVGVIHDKFKTLTEEMDVLKKELDKINAFGVLKLIDEVDINLKQLKNMAFFDFKIGILKKQDQMKLSMNYENISAMVLHIGTYDGDEVYLVLSPKELELETRRILNSIYFKEIEILDEYLDYPYVSLEKLQKRKSVIQIELKEHQREVDSFNKQFGSVVQDCYNKLMMEMATEKIKQKIAFTRSYFYFSGWVPAVFKNAIDEKLNQKYGGAIILVFNSKNDLEIDLVPPTRLKNNGLMKPFELLVTMYGTPSYDEVDPTTFLGLTYMFLFGAMFGDLGQGFVIALVGYLLSRRKSEVIGFRILTRIGFSSMLFGILYDSFFGYEHVISKAVESVIGLDRAEKIFLRPIENINTILMLSIGLGVYLLLVSFGYSIFNKLKQKNIQDGLFGRNGIAGLVLYLFLIVLVLGTVLPSVNVPSWFMILGVGITVLCIIFREPMTNLMMKHRPLYHESATEYYVESGFDILETFLSLLSNSISFIRVGAFALNHVGLFIAFHTMASLIGGLTGNVVMFLVGNLIVIFLEGLIVFIQGLRLVYYEMFSKYYTGDGFEFEASELK